MDKKITKENASDVSPKYDPIEDSMSVLLGVCNLVTPPSECKQRLRTTGYVDRILADFIKDYSMNSFVEYGDVSQTSPTFARDLQNLIINGVRPFLHTDCENISRLVKHFDKKGISQTINSNGGNRNSSVDCTGSSGTIPSGLSFHSLSDSSDNQRVPSPSGHDLALEFMSRSQYCAHSLESDLSLISEHKTGDRNKSALNRLDPDGAEDDLVRRVNVAVHGPRRIQSKDKSPSTCTYARSRYNNTKRPRRSSHSSQPLASSTMISDKSVTEFRKPDLFSMTSSSFDGKLNRFQSVDKENIQHVDDSDVSHKTTKRLRRSLNASSNLHSVDDSAYSFSINGATLKPVVQHRMKISNQNKRQNRAIRLQTIRDSEGVSLPGKDVFTNIDDLSHIKGEDHSNEKQSTLPRTSTTVWSIDDKSVTLRERFTLKPLNGTKTKQVCDPSSNFTSFDYDYTCTDSSAWYTDDIENTFGDMLVPNNSCLSIPNCDYISQAAPSSRNSFLLTSIDDTTAMRHLKPKSVIRRTSTPLPSHDVPMFRKICKRSHSDRKSGFDKKTLKHKLKHFRHSCSKEKSSVQSIRTLARL